jgi:hypothetical protein
MNKWVPKYDSKKERLGAVRKSNEPPTQEKEGRATTPKKEATSAPGRKRTTLKGKEQKPEPESLLRKVSEGKFTYSIKAKEYGFYLYKALDRRDVDLVCLVRGKGADVFVMQPSQGSKWEIITSVDIAIARNEHAFSEAILEFLKG